VPVYAGLTGLQVGQVTSRVWSSLLKKYVALAGVETEYASPGTELAMEVTVRYSRRRAPARVVKLPFFRPERMRS
jgi:glycine cleavage system aminomethyltransferase T